MFLILLPLGLLQFEVVAVELVAVALGEVVNAHFGVKLEVVAAGGLGACTGKPFNRIGLIK